MAVPLDARLVLGDQEVAFTVRELSRSGIFLYTQKPPAEVGSQLTLKLAITAGIKAIALQAKIVRISKEPSGATLGMALRFVNASAEQERAVLDLLDRAMMGRGTQMRAYPRVAFLLSARCTSRVDVGLSLLDIGEGGVGLETDQPFEKDEEISIEISRPGQHALKLRGWIVSCLPADGRPGRHRVGVCFTALTPVGRKELVDFLRQLYRR